MASAAAAAAVVAVKRHLAARAIAAEEMAAVAKVAATVVVTRAVVAKPMVVELRAAVALVVEVTEWASMESEATADVQNRTARHNHCSQCRVRSQRIANRHRHHHKSHQR